jgi:hypothetical protein
MTSTESPSIPLLALPNSPARTCDASGFPACDHVQPDPIFGSAAAECGSGRRRWRMGPRVDSYEGRESIVALTDRIKREFASLRFVVGLALGRAD